MNSLITAFLKGAWKGLAIIVLLILIVNLALVSFLPVVSLYSLREKFRSVIFSHTHAYWKYIRET
ncbi:hypothetical protein [Dysgonomonas capnocytophagoides]|uniref:hypothetical protein n=1 Tax=Dysgonomonas capnocytophagoides TaxID=45254 RepID=UPI003342E113